MNDKDRERHIVKEEPKRARGRRVFAIILLVLAWVLCIFLLTTSRQVLEKRAKKVVRKSPRPVAKTLRQVPTPAEPQIVPWPSEGPLPNLDRTGLPVASPTTDIPKTPLEKKPLQEVKLTLINKSRLFVNAEPADATIKVLNVKRKYKRGMVIKKGGYHIEVSRPGYDTKRRWIKAKKDGDNTFFIKLHRGKSLQVVKSSLVTKTRLYVNTDPQGATIKVLNIKGKYKQGMVIIKGDYYIQVSQLGYETKKRWIRVENDGVNTFFVKLRRALLAGEIDVSSIPAGAEWFLDGNLEGVTPGNKEKVVEGKHLVVVTMEGYEDWSQTVLVKPREKTIVEAELVALSPKAGDLWREPVTGMIFVWIPDGCFDMGSPDSEIGRDSDEGPVHEVCLDGFWMGHTEVTNGQYRRLDPTHDSKSHNGQSLSSENQPVVHVNWSDAKSFARWLTEKNRSTFSFRLPTEAEWEYACRAGSSSTRFWGDDPNKGCIFSNVHDRTSEGVNEFEWVHHDCNDGFAVTSPAGSLQPNAFGLYDMLGNVWEWCEDTYVENVYENHQKNNPVHIDRGPFKVNRGGSWSDIPRSVRCAVRERLAPEFGNVYVGFRLIRTP